MVKFLSMHFISSLLSVGLLIAAAPGTAKAEANTTGAKVWAISTETSRSFQDLFLNISQGEVACKGESSLRIYNNSHGLFATKYYLRTVLVVLKDGSPAVVYIGAREAGEFRADLSRDEVELLTNRVGLGFVPVCIGRSSHEEHLYDLNLK